MRPHGPSVRLQAVRWLAPALVALGLYVAAFAVALGNAVVPCRSQLQVEPEPASWRDWPAVPNDAGYVFQGHLALPRRPLYGSIDVTAPGVCADGALSLPKWLDTGINQSHVLAMYHTPDQLSLRQDPDGSGLIVVEGKSYEEPEAVFVSAFRRDDSRWAYVSGRALLLLVSLAVAIIALLGAVVRVLRTLSLGRLLRRGGRVRDGVRDAGGTIRLVDDGSMVTPAPPGPPGPVLVRVATSSPGTYREPPATRATRIWSGSRDGVEKRDREVATRALRWSVALAAGLAVGIVIIGFLLQVEDAWHSMS